MASHSDLKAASLAAHQAAQDVLRDQLDEEPTQSEIAMAMGVAFGEAMGLYELSDQDTPELTALIHDLTEQAYNAIHATALVDRAIPQTEEVKH